MSLISEKVAYLQGLAEGLKISGETPEGKLLSEIINVLGSISDEIEAQEDAQDELYDKVFELEDAVYGEEDDAHWQNVLNYCKDGNLQAMFDEYGHLLTNGLDRDEKLLPRLHRSMIEAMQVRTTAYKVDTLNDFRSRMTGKKEKAVNIRTHFAVSFTKGIGEKDADRKKSVRNSFNSPFRPFVLASTSIGQEGLDFHNYCRRIVHWNLPSNPIDLEQREGRINRFECLAIRQNIALRYGEGNFINNVWEELFDVNLRDVFILVCVLDCFFECCVDSFSRDCGMRVF